MKLVAGSRDQAPRTVPLQTTMTMRVDGKASNDMKARICLPTWRSFKTAAFQGGLYEAQDILVDVDDVDLLCLEPDRGFRFKEKWQRYFLWWDFTKKMVYINPGLRPLKLRQEYDAIIFICQNWWDLLYINAIQGWKDKVRTSICYLDELWTGLLPLYKYWLHSLNQFDYVVLGMKGTVAPLSKALGRPCHYVPGAVDAIRFSPYPKPPARVIDLYSIGRRWEGIHQALLKLASRREIFYIHDTIQGADSPMPDYRQHRELFASMAKRSQYFMVGPAKMGVPTDTFGQLEVGYRYFEGAAAGAIMVGQAPECEAFHELFGWRDAVINLAADGSNVRAVLEDLNSQPCRLQQISRQNAAEALRSHDWVYRWRQILGLAGLNASPAMEARIQRLKQLAEMAQNDDGYR